MSLAVLAVLLAAQAAEPSIPSKPMLVCRKVERETGSHIRTGRRCKTQEEWARDDEERARLSASTQVTEGQGDSLPKAATPQ